MIGAVPTVDQDAGQTLIYSITSGDPTNIFVINPANGEISLNDTSQLDGMVTPSYTLNISVIDDGLPPLSDTATITILLTDVNQPPVVDDQSFSVDENSGNGTIVGTISHVDPDFSDEHTFAVTGGSGTTAFAVNNTTGEITVVDSSQLDFELTSSFTLDIEVTDDGAPPQSDTPRSRSVSTT